MKILALTPVRDDTTSFYRAAGIFRDLKRKLPGIEVDLFNVGEISKLTWSVIGLYDIVFLQRPYNQLALARYLKLMHIPLWIDYDDNLFVIPQANQRAFDVYMTDEGIQTQLVEIAKIADVVTVSTAALKKTYDHLNADVRVIPNALPFDYIGKPHEGPTKNAVLWRGGDSHRMDLRVHEMGILQAMDKYHDWEFTFAGYNPWQFVARNKKYNKPLDPLLYFQWLKEYAPKVMQVPLVDDLFNRCKSNIAALEGTFAGAVCLIPDWEEWQIPGSFRYSNQQEYAEKLDALLRGGVSLNKYRGQALEYIRENYDLAKVNKLRADLVVELMDRGV